MHRSFDYPRVGQSGSPSCFFYHFNRQKKIASTMTEGADCDGAATDCDEVNVSFGTLNRFPSPPSIAVISLLLLDPPRLLIFGFSSLAPKKFEQCKTYLSIRNSIKSIEINFFECFRFQCYF